MDVLQVKDVARPVRKARHRTFKTCSKGSADEVGLHCLPRFNMTTRISMFRRYVKTQSFAFIYLYAIPDPGQSDPLKQIEIQKSQSFIPSTNRKTHLGTRWVEDGEPLSSTSPHHEKTPVASRQSGTLHELQGEGAEVDQQRLLGRDLSEPSSCCLTVSDGV